VKDSKNSRSFGSVLILLQGVVTVLFPQASVRLTKKMIGKNFDNAAELEANPAYLQQLRAIGVGMIAAGGTSLLLQNAENADLELSGQTDPDEEAAQSGE